MERMMQEREMLELAANAAGIVVNDWHQDDFGWVAWIDPNDKHWCPIEDDGDAFRLAVKLKMEIIPSYVQRDPDRPSIMARIMGKRVYAVVPMQDDSMRASATRLAIVRAAAEIGKQMEVK